MLKKISIFLFLGYFGSNIYAYEELQTKDLSCMQEKYGTSSISNFCNLVYRRYYFIARMRRAITLLSKINSKTSNNFSDSSESIVDIEFPKPNIFSHAKIKHCINEFAITKNFNAVIELWEELLVYKEIDDSVIVEEFARLVFLIFKNFHLHTKKEPMPKKDCELEKLHNSLVMLPLAQLIEIIDIVAELHSQKKEDLNMIENLLADALNNTGIYEDLDKTDLKSTINYYPETEIVTNRFFFIQRLAQPINLLEKLKPNSALLYSKVTNAIASILNNHLEDLRLTNDEIRLAAKKIMDSKTINPIFDAWENIKEYKHAENDDFLKQFIKLTFLIYKSLLRASKNEELIISEAEIVQNYNEFSQLSIVDMLEKIDSLAWEINDEIREIKKSHKKIWKTIAYRFWWLPTIITAGCVYFYMKK